MFGMGMPEIILILAIALIVLGPKKLPEIAKSLGKGIAEFKKATTDFKQSLNTDEDFKQAKNTLQEMKGDIHEAVQASTRPDATAGATDYTYEDDDVDDDGDDVKPAGKSEEADTEKPTGDAEASDEKTPSEKAQEEDKEKGPSANA